MTEFLALPEWRDVDQTKFRNDIAPLRKPAVLRGIAANWPAVREGQTSDEALAQYLAKFDIGKPAPAFLGPPSIEGRFWYRDDMSGVNYQQGMAPLKELLSKLMAIRTQPNAPAVYAGAVPVSEHFPEFSVHNASDLPGEGAVARLWIGNKATVATHFDESENIAFVIGGRRRFTLIPPEQVANLYVGPFDFTFAGPPVSMVDLNAPDLERYPRFAEALKTAQTAVLEPGDAIYIPYLWWHHVEALSTFNVLLNYWWDLTDARWRGSPTKALMHAIMSIRDMPERERAVWRKWFDHYVFGAGHEAVAHLPVGSRGALGEMTPQMAKIVKDYIIDEFKR